MPVSSPGGPLLGDLVERRCLSARRHPPAEARPLVDVPAANPTTSDAPTVVDNALVPTFNVPAHPGSSSTDVSSRMSRLRRRDNARELGLRKALHAQGLRFRVTYPVPGLRRRTIDVAFTHWRLAVFLDGCFWHGCPEHGTSPRSNAAWWAEKIRANQARDRDTDQHLASLGWQVLRVWEHEEIAQASERIREALDQRRASKTT